MCERKQLIVDTDAGIDDAQALLLALASPEVDILAITTVRGNADRDQVARNVLRVLQLAGRLEIPVFPGCATSLMGDATHTDCYHGADGFGDVPDPAAPGLEHVQEEHASLAIGRICREQPGEVSLVCLGPLTNVAMALRLNPQLGSQLKDCYIMGGNYQGRGNITPSAEFNFYSDPEAADIVLRELACPITLACWELCLRHKLTWAQYEALRAGSSASRDFLSEIEAFMVRRCEQLGWSSYIPCDELAMLLALDPSLATASVKASGAVETSGGRTRGQAVLEMAWQDETEEKGNLTVVTELDEGKYLALLARATAEGPMRGDGASEEESGKVLFVCCS